MARSPRDPECGHASPWRQALCGARPQGGTVGCRPLKARCALLRGQAGEVLPNPSRTPSRSGPEWDLDGFGQGTIQLARKLEAALLLHFSGKIGVGTVRPLSSGGGCVLALWSVAFPCRCRRMLSPPDSSACLRDWAPSSPVKSSFSPTTLNF